MRKERRYTEGQKHLLALDRSVLDDAERELLRRVLLPRTKYLPQSDEEGRELALQMLKEEKFAAMMASADEIDARYGGVVCSWTRGSGMWALCYSVKKDGDLLCRFGMRLDLFNLIISFGRKECARFEQERDSYPSDPVQWIFDRSATERGRKELMLDVTDEKTKPYLFRLLAYKKQPPTDTRS